MNSTVAKNKRKLLRDADPKAFDTMLAFQRYLTSSSLTRTHAELIKIRVSQMNGCSYCLDKHIREALAAGESGRRIHLLAVWRETDLFTPEEQAILALAEEMTYIHRHGVSDETYDQAIRLLGQQYTTEVMMAIIAMNAWNRVGITTGRTPE
jgi:AhpD family alkylhydroperoxidase